MCLGKIADNYLNVVLRVNESKGINSIIIIDTKVCRMDICIYIPLPLYFLHISRKLFSRMNLEGEYI